jgi:hypothetical protein
MRVPSLQGSKRTCFLRPCGAAPRPLKFKVDGQLDAFARQALNLHNGNSDMMPLFTQRHMQFAHYASRRHLAVDVFDASSHLYIGTVSLPLMGLLRQGREHAETLLKADVVPADAGVPRTAPTSASTGVLQVHNLCKLNTLSNVMSSGKQHAAHMYMQVRMINIGSRPEHVDSVVAAVQSAGRRQTGSHTLCVRSTSLLETDTPVVSELVPVWHHSAAEDTLASAVCSLSDSAASPNWAGTFRKPSASPEVQCSTHAINTNDLAQSKLSILLHAIRGEEERKVHRETRLRHAGVSFVRPLPCTVCFLLPHLFTCMCQ